MKQPILFKSRIIDLAEVEERIGHVTARRYYNVSGAFTLFQFLLTAPHADVKHVEDILKEYFDIEISGMRYMRLEQPYAVNKLTGEAHPVLNLEFTESGKLDGVILFDSGKSTSNLLIYWSDINSPLHRFKSKRRESADIEILYDGWFE